MNIEKELQNFCKEINGGEAIVVPHRPEAWARHDYCFANVTRKVSESGGKMQVGWQFIQMPVGSSPGALIAVHHAVWEGPENGPSDITPFCPKGIVLRTAGGVWFLPDASATVLRPLGYEIGISRPSRFYALAGTAKVRKMIEAARLRERQYWEEVTSA